MWTLFLSGWMLGRIDVSDVRCMSVVGDVLVCFSGILYGVLFVVVS